MLIAWPLLAFTAIFFAAWMKPALPNGEWFQVRGEEGEEWFQVRGGGGEWFQVRGEEGEEWFQVGGEEWFQVRGEEGEGSEEDIEWF